VWQIQIGYDRRISNGASISILRRAINNCMRTLRSGLTVCSVDVAAPVFTQ
jgi:hypothetical protein